jgi:hypothetical protein
VLGTLKDSYSLVELSHPLSDSLGLVVASLVRLRASSVLHQGFDLCGTRVSSSKWLICYSWKLPLPRRLGGGTIR